MNEPEDPTTSSRPAPYGDPPDQQRTSSSVGGPPAEPAAEPVSEPRPTPPPAEPEATWEDVVDPAPVVIPDPAPPADDWPEPNRIRASAAAPSPARAPAARATPVPVTDDEDEDSYDDDYAEGPASRWVSLLATLGTALIAIVTVQVITSLIEGLTLKSGQRVNVPDDVFHRIGYPFGGLGATALVFLVLGVVLVSMPSVLGELLSEPQDRVVGAALVVSVAVGVVIAIGSLLAVRANLHEYSAKNVAVPAAVRVQFTNFLLGSLGAAALALFGSIAAMNERKREEV